MTILFDQRDRAIVERRQNHRATAMMDDFANVRAIRFADRIDAYVENATAKYFLRIDELRSLLSHVLLPDKLQEL